jgi:hypothetical protein
MHSRCRQQGFARRWETISRGPPSSEPGRDTRCEWVESCWVDYGDQEAWKSGVDCVKSCGHGKRAQSTGMCLVSECNIVVYLQWMNVG